MREDQIEHDPESGPILKHSIVSARAWDRYVFMDERGQPATLAIIDRDGNVLDSGPEVAREIWNIAILAYRRYLKGETFRTIISSPDGLFQEKGR
ncbi:hypothetical protein G3N95_24035 [Paraburkholderia sp. Tr-20389]|uniref:hypothetical protein n=1 Tax=Paraburkholderia sp. Tr-20389 TaxID=2703903 RepID=UPI00197CFD88|nr:hypothetical protein [Paraburkholderia sp. Tr-20389]MBN3756033.1 hypothetical protein [Paraburkholderia sp. Tr-20389]